MAAQAQAMMLVQPAAAVPRVDSLEDDQQVAAAPDMAAGVLKEGPSTGRGMGVPQAHSPPPPQQVVGGSRAGQEASHAPLPQLPDFSSLDMPDARKRRNSQVAVLLQLARELKGPESVGQVVRRLRTYTDQDLSAVMAEWYDPVQLVQTAGGSEADVRALANELLDRITAGQPEQAGLGA
jgi:hypothetical protein